MSGYSRVARSKRHNRVRRRVKGTSDCPRLNVFRSLQHIYAQVVDDEKGHTLVAASSLELSDKAAPNYKNKVESAKVVGKLLAERAISEGVRRVVFDRGGYKYHGRVKHLAEGAREAGLEF